MTLRAGQGFGSNHPTALRIEQNQLDAQLERVRLGAEIAPANNAMTPADRVRDVQNDQLRNTRNTDAPRDQAWQPHRLRSWESNPNHRDRRRNADDQHTESQAAVVIDNDRFDPDRARQRARQRSRGQAQGTEQGVPRDPNPSGPLVRPPRPLDTEAWRAWRQAHDVAAVFEEHAMEHCSPVVSPPADAYRRRAYFLRDDQA